MNRRSACLVVILFTAGCASRTGRSTERLTAESEVRVAERQRFEAMLKQDAAALDTLLDADLTYVHTGGDMETKAQLVELIRSKKLIYESIAPSDVRVRVHDGLALATGRSQMRVRNATGVSSFGIRFTEVYVRRGGRWLLTAWEATKLVK
ncbi:MAG TPA: nuclear transport factor 2 family protein [Gemmatimonadaceae bacterium]|nr:nuclear transport factor 2 family protein [Gemmatimonadaceae bacterium]